MKQIIILTVDRPGGSDLNINWLFWLYPVPGREIPLPVQKNPDGSVIVNPKYSVWRDASDADNQAIGSGAIIEESYSAQYPSGTGKPLIESDLVARYNARAAQLSAKTNPNQFYGTFFDSVSGWSA